MSDVDILVRNRTAAAASCIGWMSTIIYSARMGIVVIPPAVLALGDDYLAAYNEADKLVEDAVFGDSNDASQEAQD